MFDTLILPEMDLVKFVSRVRNLKLPIGGNLNPLNVEVPSDAQNKVTIYELWGNEDSNWLDVCVSVGEELLKVGILYPD